ncbi:MAG: T9SS type A sorting domain-containing protein [Chitinophagaceae bacterium]
MRKFYLLLAIAGFTYQGIQAQTCTNAASAGPCTGGNVTEDFNGNSGTFTSANFTYNAGAGRFNVNPASRNSAYTITSGVYTLSASGGVLGFSVTGSTSSISSVTLRIINASTSAVLFTCNQNAGSFVSAGQTCVQFSGLTSGTAVRYQFVINTANGSSGDGIVVFDNFSNGGSAAALPVKLDNFDAAKEGSTIKLTWTTALEAGVARYEVQRSVDGVNFQTIGSVNADSKKTYTYSDALPVASNNFYRLRIIDLDGTVRVSHVVSAKSKVSAAIEVYPNPVRNTMVVQHPKAISGSRLQVVNLTGQVVKDVQVAANAVVTPLDLTGMSNGSYYIVFRSGSENFSQRITKQ